MNRMVRIVAAVLMILSTGAILNAAQRHWVGNGAGQGKDWNRAANWSATQGGAGGAGIPTAADDVYIDGGGGLLTINVAAVCLSFHQSQSGHTTDFLGSGSMVIGTGGFHLSAGTFDISNNNNISVAGDWIVTGGTFSSGTSTLTFNGSTAQTFVSGASLYNQVINNSSGLILGSDLTVSNTLTLTSGPIVTGSYSVIVPPTGNIVQGSGYISGNLSKYVATGATTVTFELGSGGSASTVTVAFGSVGTTGYLTASSTSGDHPNIGSSTINPNYSVNRYWTLANNGVVFDTYGVTFQYGAGDIDPLADPLTFQVGRYASSAWNASTVGTRTATSTQATGLTGFGAFAIGHAAVYDTITAAASAGGTIAPSGDVAVMRGSNQSFTITPDAGHHIDSVVVDGGKTDSTTGYTFMHVTANHSISAYFTVDTMTITATASAGGSISPSGTVPVPYGGDRSFTVTPDAGYHIDSVVVDGANQGAVGSYDFTNVTADHAIDAYFSIDMYAITASAGTGGSIDPSGAVPVAHGSDQSFTITPDVGYFIADVHVDTVSVGAVGSYTFTGVTADHSIEAFFAPYTFTLSAFAGPNGSISPAGDSVVNYGESVSYAISPSTGYYISDVFVDSVSVGPVDAYTFSGVTEDHSIQAFFAIQQFTVTATAGPNGTVAPAGASTVDYGGSIGYTITPDAGYHIDSVVVDGANQGAVGSYDFTNVTADHTIDAYFSIDMYAITASAGTGGSIDPSGTVPVAHGSDQSFTITPDVGYFIADVHVDTVSVGAVGSYTFTNVTADHSIEAFFDPYTFTLSAFAGPNGSISPAGDSVVNYGESVSYAISPSTGYYISDVFVDSVSVGPVDSYTFSGVTEDHSIQAFFAIQQFTVTATAGPNGTVAPAGASTVDYGGSIGYTITPNTGYYIADVHVDSASVGAVASYTFNNVTADHTIEAWFSITAYTITATSSPGGSIAPSGPVGVNHGENRSFAMTPDPGHHLDSVVVDGANLGAVASYEFTNVTASHTIAAYFSVNMYTITASAGTGGGIAPSGDVAVAHGSDVTFTVTPNTGYFIADVHVDTVSVGAAASYTFTNVTSDHVIEAFFSVQTFTVTAVAGPNGSVSPSGATVVNYGDSLHIAVTPAGGYFVTDVHVDSVSVGPVTGYTFTNITSDHLLEAFFGTNAPPSGPTLVSPVDGDTITTDQLGSVVFAWNPSTDPDAGDTLVYEVHITGPGVDYTAGGLTDTTADLDLSAVLAAGSVYRWTVTVSDGMATVASADTFTIRVDLATDVADDADLLPKVYALRQNYPNPFNPVTAIPFDLPERSTVTLRVFNVLGVQVMEIFSDESIGAGSYRKSVDFSGLSSGAYFYRLSARGENGTVFEKVMKMVVLK